MQYPSLLLFESFNVVLFSTTLIFLFSIISFNINDNLSERSALALSSNIEYVGSAFKNVTLKTTSLNNCQYLGNEENPYLMLYSVEDKTLNDYSIHKDTKIIYEKAFSECKMKNINIPDNVLYIGKNAFNNCINLVGIKLSKNLRKIDSYAFSKCSSIQSIELPEGLTELGDYAFSSCSSLTEIKFPKSLSKIGDDAFSKCSSLTNVIFPSALRILGSSIFSQCDNLEYIVLPQTLTWVGSDICEMCDNVIIYCESASKPTYWVDRWNSSNQPIYWGNQWSYVDGVPTLNI